ncbi:hypothetical protein [Aeromonas sp. s11]|uniref:hypothetical protein n=1 Tax=Aeromonas sp. s11 TaxID=3138481 RepID=UPI0034A37152
MTKSIFSRAAHHADQIIATIADHVSGNKARRARLRRQKLAEKRAIANERLGRIPKGHRAMLIARIQYHIDSI